MLDIQEEEEETWSLMNLDSGDTILVDPPVWEQDSLLSDEVMAWLEEWMATLEDPSSLKSSVDLQDLWEDMSVEEWEQLLEDLFNDVV